MVNILKALCKKLNIELSYTNNKVIILSCNFKNNHPLIRAHKIFRGCNENISYAIIDYYTKAEKKEENLKIIRDYADENFNSLRYKITPPNDEFKKSVLVELNISSITKKDSYGNPCTLNPNNPLMINKAEDGILEVNITVNPLN